VVVLKDTLSSVHDLSHIKSTLYPNPNDGQFTIELEEACKDGRLLIYDEVGRLVYSEDHLNGSVFSFKTKLSKEIYLLELKTQVGSPSKKLIIE